MCRIERKKKNPKIQPLCHLPHFEAESRQRSREWSFPFSSAGGTCALMQRPLIGSGSPKPPPVLATPWQCISLPGAHVRRQMESESMSGLSEMSFTSAARKESGHSRSGITWWKGGVSESEFNFNLSDPEVKERWAAGWKSQTDRQVRW